MQEQVKNSKGEKFKQFLLNLPEIQPPLHRPDFKQKLKWTLLIVLFFFILAQTPLWGLESNTLARFQYLALLLGAKFGSILTLGIGPIVTASIILQLLVGAKLINIDMKTPEGRQYFEGLQKFLTILFIIFEAAVYVLMRGLVAKPGLESVVILQLIVGGLIIMFMDELSSKYGFGSGISLFILCGVALSLIVQAFGFLGPGGHFEPVGKVISLGISLASGNLKEAYLSLAAILGTIIVFAIVVYAQALRVELPISFGRLRGFSLKWPLQFLYTSVIPVILAAVLLANLQLLANLAQQKGIYWLGKFEAGRPVAGLVYWLSAPSGGLPRYFLTHGFDLRVVLKSLTYLLFMVFACMGFSLLWVNTAGMDPRSQAEQLTAYGFQIPGFRQDPRMIETLLRRYITPLALMGGAAIGLLAALADLLGALVSGTSLLLAVMIAYQLNLTISRQHAFDMPPFFRKIFRM